MNINDFREKRMKLLNEAKELTGKDNYTAEDKIKTDALLSEIDQVEARIKILEKEDLSDQPGKEEKTVHIETTFRNKEVTVYQAPNFYVKRNVPTLGKIIKAMYSGEDLRSLGASSDSTGGVLTPEPLMKEIIQSLQDESVIFKAGAKVYDLQSDSNILAKIASPASLHWRAENNLIENDDPTFSRASFVPKTVAAVIKVPTELMEDSYNLEGAIREMFIRAMAAEIDRVALIGESGNTEPVGISQWESLAHITDLDGSALINTGAFFYLGYILSKIMAEKSPTPNAIIASPEVLVGLETLQDSTYQPLQKPGLLNNMAWYSTTALSGSSTSDMFIGYFPNMAVGIRSQLKIRMLDQRYADYYQTGILCSMRLDVQPIWEQSFGMIQNIGHPLSTYS